MAYTAGDTILATHYNSFVSDFNTIWGTGSGENGWGQSNTLSTVSAGDTVTATQWATLLARCTTAATHCGTSITSITSPSAGDTISAFTALAANITAISGEGLNPKSKHVADTGNYADTTSSTNGTASWTTSTVHIFTLTFAGGDEARYYYNAGGSTRLTFSRAGGTSHTKNTEWANLATACGTVIFAVQGTTKSGGSGSTTTLATTIGYQDMTTSDQTLFKQMEGDNPYTSNYILVEAKTNAVDSDGNGDNGNILTLKVSWVDAAGDTFDDTVDGTVTDTITHRTPNTNTLNNASWSAAPSYSSTSFTQS
jgi:hypothetical protein